MFLLIFHKFMRSSFSLVLWAIVLIAVVGCSDDKSDFVISDKPQSGYLTVSLKCLNSTRTEEESDYTEDDNITELNENLIKTVTVCLWPNDATLTDENVKPKDYYVQTFSVEKREKATLRIPLTRQLVDVLFNTEPKCNIFVAANVTPPDGSYTIQEFRNKTITSTFATKQIQRDFAMDGGDEVTYNSVDNTATASVKLRSSASKITLSLNVDEAVEQSIVIDGELVTSVWAPITDGMQVWLKGGLKESTLDPRIEYDEINKKPDPSLFFDTPFVAERQDQYLFKEDATPDNGKDNPTEYSYPFTQNIPFYTYPHTWTSDPNDYASTFMLLAIPWMQPQVNTEGELVKDENGKPIQKPGTSIRTCYYQVPVIAANSDILQLIRNVSYHIYLHVGILGSFIPDEPLELTDLKYSAADWGNVNMNVEIPDIRYLVVDQNDYTVNNETTITIPFYTSHEITVVSANMKFYRYNFTEAGIEHAVTVDMNQNRRTFIESGGTNSPDAYHVFTADFNKNNELIVTHDLKIFVPYDENGNEVSLTNNDNWNVQPWSRPPTSESNWANTISNIKYFKKQSESTAQSPSINDEYSKVEFEIVVQHKDINANGNTTDFKETITITQYPGMYIETVKNYTAANASEFRYNGNQGNTFINTVDTDISSGTATLNRYGNSVSGNGTSHYLSAGNSDGWMQSIGLNSSYPYYNWNPNMYLVTVTQLPQGTDYIIGEPRTNKSNIYLGSKGYDRNDTRKVYDYNAELVDEVNSNLWHGQTYTYDYYPNSTATTPNANSPYQIRVNGFYADALGKNLEYYYPTMEDEAHKNMIAPKFRLCSSYGGTSWVLNRELARRRAASYQELNYPAGRWRLPTFGEVSFIMQLCAEYKLPRLFGAFSIDWWYWCAHGLIYVPMKNMNPNTSGYAENSKIRLCDVDASGAIVLPQVTGDHAAHRSRFVYDEWYWGPADLGGRTEFYTPGNYTFYWGDEPYRDTSTTN